VIVRTAFAELHDTAIARQSIMMRRRSPGLLHSAKPGAAHRA
jgi:hypothetical protein